MCRYVCVYIYMRMPNDVCLVNYAPWAVTMMMCAERSLRKTQRRKTLLHVYVYVYVHMCVCVWVGFI